MTRKVRYEDRKDVQAAMKNALALLHLLQASRLGATAVEIGKRLGISDTHAKRLLNAAEFAGWPLVRDDEFRWKLAR